MNQPTTGVRHAALLLALLAVTACASAPRKTSEQRVADQETAERVQSALAADTHIFTRHITVQADNGVVHLGGFVWSDYDQWEAQRIAESVPGVTQVLNEMELERQGIDNSPVSR